jgi:hypothetical protein
MPTVILLSAMALRIPQEDLPALSTVAGLQSSQLDRFIDAVNSVPPNRDSAALAKLIAKKIPSVPVDRLIRVLDMLQTLYDIRELSGVSAETFCEDLIDSIRSNPDAQLSKRQLPKIRLFFEKILEIGNLRTLAKASRLQRDGERLYCSAKILTDVRPVFKTDPSERPEGAVVTHTLKMGYHEGSAHKEFHVVLDTGDLVALNDAVSRALAKDKTLRDLLADAKLNDLGA